MEKKYKYSFNDVLLKAATMRRENLDLRMGQSLMNALPDEVYEAITNTELDCFYDDNKYWKLIEYLDENLER